MASEAIHTTEIGPKIHRRLESGASKPKVSFRFRRLREKAEQLLADLKEMEQANYNLSKARLHLIATRIRNFNLRMSMRLADLKPVLESAALLKMVSDFEHVISQTTRCLPDDSETTAMDLKRVKNPVMAYSLRLRELDAILTYSTGQAYRDRS